MKVLVDTRIWSMALRRTISPEQDTVVELANLIRDRRVQIIGPITVTFGPRPQFCGAAIRSKADRTRMPHRVTVTGRSG